MAKITFKNEGSIECFIRRTKDGNSWQMCNAERTIDTDDIKNFWGMKNSVTGEDMPHAFMQMIGGEEYILHRRPYLQMVEFFQSNREPSPPLDLHKILPDGTKVKMWHNFNTIDATLTDLLKMQDEVADALSRYTVAEAHLDMKERGQL